MLSAEGHLTRHRLNRRALHLPSSQAKGRATLLAVSGSGGQESPSDEGHYRQDKAAECESEEINGVG